MLLTFTSTHPDLSIMTRSAIYEDKNQWNHNKLPNWLTFVMMQQLCQTYYHNN